jgi:protein involved in polysaccharide export with SLBB domain
MTLLKRISATLVAAAASALIAPAAAFADSGSVLHRGDKVLVAVFNHPELTTGPMTPLTVGNDGNVSVPGAGTIPAAGATLAAFNDRIRAALARFIRQPVVDVQRVGEGQSIFVAGGPGGVLAFSPGETLLAALGQLTIGLGVDLRNVGILRNGVKLGTYDVPNLRAAGETGPALMPGDELQLPSKPVTVTVSGAVVQPGLTYVDKTEPLSAALSQVGGLQTDANTGDVVLIRNGVRKSYALGSETLGEPGQPGDQLIVQHAARVEVFGMVEKSGQATLRSDKSLLAALYQLGGPNRFGDLKHVTVTHEGVQSMFDITRLAHGDLTQNPTLADGDVVFIPEGYKVDFRGIFQTLLYGVGAANAGQRLHP